MTRSIDLNCDMGESPDDAGIANDAAIMDHVTSVNVACGFHAGSPTVMRRTVEAALAKGVAVGAHPSFFDRGNFGRTVMSVPASEVFDIVLYQISAMKGICESLGGRMHHVKPHGALYNQAAADPGLAAAVASAVKACDERLVLYGLSGSCLISEAGKIGLATASEVFSDRTYQNDGSLTPRNEPNALIEDADDAVAQVISMIETGAVTSTGHRSVPMVAETVCVHGDGPHALEFASALKEALTARGIEMGSRR